MFCVAITTYSLQSAGNRGYVLQLCNAIRLQADTMPPTEFLRAYLNSHEQWRNFLGDLREATLQQQTPGLGFEVRAATWLQIFSPTLCPACISAGLPSLCTLAIPTMYSCRMSTRPAYALPRSAIPGARRSSIFLQRARASWKSTAP